MRFVRRVRPLLAVLICGTAVLGATACSSTTDGPRPGGTGSTAYTTVTEGHLTARIPASWRKSTDVAEPFTVEYFGDGMEVRLAGEFSDDTGAYSALGRLDLPAGLHLDGYRPVQTGKIAVHGAYDAVERSYTYRDGGTARRGVWVVATQWPYPATAVLSISGTTLDDDVVAYLTRTLELRTYQ